MARRGWGRIVNVASSAGKRPSQAMPAYSVAKAGLRMAMKCLAIELAPHRVLVNEIAPGKVDAGLTAQLIARDTARRNRRFRLRIPQRQQCLVEIFRRRV